jgi:subtilase family serine protease
MYQRNRFSGEEIHMIRMAVLLFVVGAAAAGLSGCKSGPSPSPQVAAIDLVPLSSDASGQFCNKRDVGTVIVTVKNIGTVDATDSSVTTVQFDSGTQQFPTPPLKANGGSISFDVSIPNGCSSCFALITVNSTNTVSESNTTNNQLQCQALIR